MSSSDSDAQSERREPTGSKEAPGLWGNNPIVLSTSDSGTDPASCSSAYSSDARSSSDVEEVLPFEYYDGRYAGLSLRGGVDNPPQHWELQGADDNTYGITMPLRTLGSKKIAEWRENAGIPNEVILRSANWGEDPTRLPENLACIHAVLFNWGLRLPVPRFLAQFCAYLEVPIGQLSVNTMWILTCLHVLWRVSGCEYPTPAEILQLYAPRLGTRKGHQGVVELKERITGGGEQRPLLHGQSTSQTVFRDHWFVAVKGWRYATRNSVRPFKSYGTWGPLKIGNASTPYAFGHIFIDFSWI